MQSNIIKKILGLAKNQKTDGEHSQVNKEWLFPAYPTNKRNKYLIKSAAEVFKIRSFQEQMYYKNRRLIPHFYCKDLSSASNI